MNTPTIETLRARAIASGDYAGISEPTFKYSGGLLWFATLAVFRVIGGRRIRFTATARYEECAAYADPEYRAAKPHQWLAECAELMALAQAFPTGVAAVAA